MHNHPVTTQHPHLPLQQALSPQTLIAVRALHETAALRIQESLAEQWQERIRVDLLSIEHGPMGRFLVDDAELDCYRAYSISPLDGIWYLGIQLSLAQTMIDKLLVQFPPTAEDTPRLTELERRLLKQPAGQIFDALLRGWSEIAELEVVGEQSLMEPPSQLRMQLAETGICATWKVTQVAPQETQLGLCSVYMPCSTLLPLSPLLLRRYAHLLASLTHHGAQAAAGSGKPMTAAAWNGGCTIPVSVNLARSTLHQRELSDLQVGDVLMLEQSTEEAMEVWVSGFGTYFGRLGAIQGKKAVEIIHTPADQLQVGSPLEQASAKSDVPCVSEQDSEAAA